MTEQQQTETAGRRAPLGYRVHVGAHVVHVAGCGEVDARFTVLWGWRFDSDVACAVCLPAGLPVEDAPGVVRGVAEPVVAPRRRKAPVAAVGVAEGLAGAVEPVGPPAGRQEPVVASLEPVGALF